MSDALAPATPPRGPSERPSASRPTQLTADMKLAAAKALAADIQRDCSDFRDEPLDELAEQIASCANGPFTDGYEIGKRLDDRCGWSVDALMVETLDTWSVYAQQELAAAQKKWIEETTPTSPHRLGDRIAFHGGKTGLITALRDKTAQYEVAEDGDAEAHTFTNRRWIINWEDARALEASGITPSSTDGEDGGTT